MKTILVDAVGCFVQEDGQIFEDMRSLLEAYPNKKIILTGASKENFNKYNLDKMPYEVFTLEHNPEKTEPKYFEKMLSQFNLDKQKVIYFEHNPKAVQSAQATGITAYFYDADKKDLSGLKKFIEDNL